MAQPRIAPIVRRVLGAVNKHIPLSFIESQSRNMSDHLNHHEPDIIRI
jgi:hypothetical protein